MTGQTHYDSGPGNLPNDTKIAVVVAVDEIWLQMNNVQDFAALETTITNSIRNAQSWYITITDFTYIQLSGGNVTNDFDEGKIVDVFYLNSINQSFCFFG